jgi:hypothetical protein
MRMSGSSPARVTKLFGRLLPRKKWPQIAYDLGKETPLEEQNAPATKGDIASLERRIDEKIELLRSEVSHGYRDIIERIADSQTSFSMPSTAMRRAITSVSPH